MKAKVLIMFVGQGDVWGSEIIWFVDLPPEVKNPQTYAIKKIKQKLSPKELSLITAMLIELI